jgi:Predicted acetyltransferase
MKLIYKKANENDIEKLVDFKIKQSLFNSIKNGSKFENEKPARKNIKRILEQELNKTIYFFVAADENNSKIVACNGVIVHQMIPSTSFLNGKKAYITSVYTEEEYRTMGIQNTLMKMCLMFLEEIECRKIELDASNPVAIKLYKKFGFTKDIEKYILNI